MFLKAVTTGYFEAECGAPVMFGNFSGSPQSRACSDIREWINHTHLPPKAILRLYRYRIIRRMWRVLSVVMKMPGFEGQFSQLYEIDDPREI